MPINQTHFCLSQAILYQALKTPTLQSFIFISRFSYIKISLKIESLFNICTSLQTSFLFSFQQFIFNSLYFFSQSCLMLSYPQLVIFELHFYFQTLTTFFTFFTIFLEYNIGFLLNNYIVRFLLIQKQKILKNRIN